jgi:hypothetical protein
MRSVASVVALFRQLNVESVFLVALSSGMLLPIDRKRGAPDFAGQPGRGTAVTGTDHTSKLVSFSVCDLEMQLSSKASLLWHVVALSLNAPSKARRGCYATKREHTTTNGDQDV